MSDALDLWREKLAGVTPLVAEARNEAAFHRANGPDPNVAVLITRLADALELLSGSRILADEATVGKLRDMLWALERPWSADPYEQDALACLNHLAQLALEKDHE